MSRTEAGGKRCEPRSRSALIAAYREGLGLAAVAVTCGPAGIRVRAADQGCGGVSAADAAAMRWWCRRVADAERLAAAAMRRLERRESRNGAGSAGLESASSTALAGDAPYALARAAQTIVAAARRLRITLLSDDEVAAEAMSVIARVDEEIEKLHRCGELKTVNKSYRAYRIEASTRGEKTLRYDEWMGQYRENLVRQLAATLRYV